MLILFKVIFGGQQFLIVLVCVVCPKWLNDDLKPWKNFKMKASSWSLSFTVRCMHWSASMPLSMHPCLTRWVRMLLCYWSSSHLLFWFTQAKVTCNKTWLYIYKDTEVKIDLEYSVAWWNRIRAKRCKLGTNHLFQRRDIVTGTVEPTEEECDWPSDDEKEEENKLAVSVRTFSFPFFLLCPCRVPL